MKHTTKNTLKPGAIALGLGLMLTTLCYGQGPGRNVIYWDGANNLPQLVSSAYNVIIVDFITPDQYCNFGITVACRAVSKPASSCCTTPAKLSWSHSGAQTT